VEAEVRGRSSSHVWLDDIRSHLQSEHHDLCGQAGSAIAEAEAPLEEAVEDVAHHEEVVVVSEAQKEARRPLSYDHAYLPPYQQSPANQLLRRNPIATPASSSAAAKRTTSSPRTSPPANPSTAKSASPSNPPPNQRPSQTATHQPPRPNTVSGTPSARSSPPGF